MPSQREAKPTKPSSSGWPPIYLALLASSASLQLRASAVLSCLLAAQEGAGAAPNSRRPTKPARSSSSGLSSKSRAYHVCMHARMQPEACFRAAQTLAQEQPRSTAEPPGGTGPEPTQTHVEAHGSTARKRPGTPAATNPEANPHAGLLNRRVSFFSC